MTLNAKMATNMIRLKILAAVSLTAMLVVVVVVFEAVVVVVVVVAVLLLVWVPRTLHGTFVIPKRFW